MFFKKHWFKLGIAAVCVVLAVVIAVQRLEPDAIPVEGKAPDFELVDLEGQNVTLDNTAGRARIVYFFFANCPDVCGPTTFILSQIQDGLKKEGDFGDKSAILQVTFDPERDTPEALLEYSERFHPDRTGWRFLRGDEEYIKQVAKSYGLGIAKDDKGNFMHTNIITVVDKFGNIRKRYFPQRDDFKYETVVKDMVQLAKE